jgi:hypothetical protein
VDVAAKQYLEKATGNINHLVPVDVIADGNCLYHSIILLMNNSSVTTNELRGIQIYFPYLDYVILRIYFLMCYSFVN